MFAHTARINGPACKRLLLLLFGIVLAAVPITANSQAGTKGWITFANADRVTVLHARGDTLWAGTDGGGLVEWNVSQGSFVQRLYPQGTLAGNFVTEIAMAPDGSLWVATKGGVSYYQPDGTARDFTMRNTGYREDEVRTTVREARSAGMTVIPVTLPSEEAARSAFRPGYLMFGNDPTIYFYAGWDAAQQAVVIRPELRQAVSPGTPVYAFRPGLAADEVRDIEIDASGRVWISTVHGVNVFDDGRWTVYTTLNSSLPEDDTRALAIDGAGRVWMSHLTPGRITMFDGNWHTMQIQGVIHALVVDPQGNVWAATSPVCEPSSGRCIGGGVWRFDGTQWQSVYTQENGIADNWVTDVVFGARGQLWLGHTSPDSRGPVVSARTTAHWVVYETIQDAIESDFAEIRTTQTPNDLWAVAGDRVWTRHLGAIRGYDGRTWTALYTGNTILNSNAIRALATDDQNRVWVGTEPMSDGLQLVNGGVNLWDGTRWKHYTRANSGLPNNYVEAIMAGRHGRVWVQTTDKQVHSLRGESWDSYPTVEALVEAEYGAIADTLDIAAVNEPRLWRVDAQRRVWVWGTGARFFDGTQWTEYRFENGVRKKTPEVGYLQGPVRKGDITIPVEFEDSITAQSRFPNGYLMIGDDPTLYRYESFIPWDPQNRIQISPPAKRDFPPNEPIYAVELGLLSTVVQALDFGPDGRVWFASSAAVSGSTPLYGGISVLDPETGEWTHYTVQNTSRRGERVGHVTAEVDPQEATATLIPVSFPDAATADALLASGYVMFEGDPTLYRYLGFFEGAIRVQPIFSTTPFVGAQQRLPAGTGVYAVEIGLASNTVTHLSFDSDGTLWVVVPSVGVQSFNGSVWTLYRFGEQGLPRRVEVQTMITRGREVWIGTSNNGFSVFQDGVWNTYNVFNSGLADDRIRAFTITADGRLWIGTKENGISVLTLPGFQLSPALTTALVKPGGQVVVPLYIQTNPRFSGTIVLTAEELPPGIEATFSPPSLSGSGTVDLILTVSPFTAPAEYLVAVTARSDDGLSTTRRIKLRVAAQLWNVYTPLHTR